MSTTARHSSVITALQKTVVRRMHHWLGELEMVPLSRFQCESRRPLDGDIRYEADRRMRCLGFEEHVLKQDERVSPPYIGHDSFPSLCCVTA